MVKNSQRSIISYFASLRLSVFFFHLMVLMQTAVFAGDLEFDWTWIGNENDLFFKIDLNEGLYFDSVYTVHSNEVGQSCDISCKPHADHPFQTSDGYQLKNINISVTVENTGYAREVFYKIKANSSYWLLDDEGKRQAFVVDYLYEDFLLNSTIDVTEEPLFYSFLEKEDSGVIRFINLFRCTD